MTPNKPLVVVKWLDANATQMALYSEGDVPHEPMVAYTMGWMIRDDALGISLANEYFEDDATWRGTTFIPRGMVADVFKIALSRRRPSRMPVAPVLSNSDGGARP